MNPLIFFQLALRNLRLNKFRSILAILGITIGIVAIATTGMSGAILENSQFQSMNEIGESIYLQVNYTYLWQQQEQTNNFYGVKSGGAVAVSSVSTSREYVQPEMEGITDKQIRELSKITAPYPVIPYKQTMSTFEIVEDEYSDKKRQEKDPNDFWSRYVTIYGIENEYLPSMFVLESGKFPKVKSEVLVGSKFAKKNEVTVGDELIFTVYKSGQQKNVKVKISGIMKNTGEGLMISSDNSIVGSNSWFNTNFNTYSMITKGYESAVVVVKDVNKAPEMQDQINAYLNKKGNRVDITNSSAATQPVKDIIASSSKEMMSMGAIALLVAAVGIFNVMLMSVTQRTHEIGILRSIGTKKRQILTMFLCEAGMMSVLGSIIGGLLSLVFALFKARDMIAQSAATLNPNAALMQMMGIPVDEVQVSLADVLNYTFSANVLMYIPLGILIGVTVGLLSALYPAWRAANMDPIDALNEQ
ncbi:ABC transporter permease [Methanorbis furvi]|uniref:ABC transporter permease n=1 Tax=Methanorbis furvi TaxID=3028299 RepID=A0AAE4SB43_9EURY|nr:hypothetical protein [Methanocorpusculaceae archaeon Ag1]